MNFANFRIFCQIAIRRPVLASTSVRHLQAHRRNADALLFHGAPEATVANIQADGRPSLQFAANGELTLWVGDKQIRGPAHPLFIGILLEQDLPIFPVSLCVLEHHRHKLATQFLSH